MNEQEMRFYSGLRATIRTNPEWVKTAQSAIQDGITEALAESRGFAVDMETIAAMALETRLFKGNQGFIADKIEKWKSVCSLNWDHMVEKVRTMGSKKW